MILSALFFTCPMALFRPDTTANNGAAHCVATGKVASDRAAAR